MKETDLYSVDWVKFIERKQSLFLMSSFIRPEYPMLAETTGFRFQYEFSVQRGSYCAWYRSQKELEACDEYFAKLVSEKDPRLVEWAQRCRELYGEADQLLARFSSKEIVFKPSEYASLMRTIENIFLYSAEVDSFVLWGMELLMKRGASRESLAFYLDLYEPLRAQSRYPQIGATVFPAMWRAAALLQPEASVELVSFATPIELRGLFDGSRPLDLGELKKRTNWCLFWQASDQGEFTFLYDETIDLPALRVATTDVKEFKGTIGYKGNVKGIVRIVSGPEDMYEFRDGEILVAIHTNPALLPIMIRCAAIVTDEGGLASHAAIVARELKKPCIIGTKVATQVFKTGDLIQVDAESGIVRKLQK